MHSQMSINALNASLLSATSLLLYHLMVGAVEIRHLFMSGKCNLQRQIWLTSGNCQNCGIGTNCGMGIISTGAVEIRHLFMSGKSNLQRQIWLTSGNFQNCGIGTNCGMGIILCAVTEKLMFIMY
jgi:hypothetical protein